jgi:hypothetical protein
MVGRVKGREEKKEIIVTHFFNTASPPPRHRAFSDIGNLLGNLAWPLGADERVAADDSVKTGEVSGAERCRVWVLRGSEGRRAVRRGRRVERNCIVGVCWVRGDWVAVGGCCRGVCSCYKREFNSVYAGLKGFCGVLRCCLDED